LKKDEDLLVQLNAIEIVSDLAESKRGFQYLTNMNVLSQMDARLNDISSGSYASFLMPGYIKFFGHMAFHSPTNFHEMYPSFSAILMNMLTSDITESQILALEVISHIAVKWKGKEMLQSRNEVQEKVYEVLRKQIKSGPSALRVRALGAFANIIKNVDESGEVPDIARDLFDKLEPPNNTMPAIIGLAKQPFADISAAAYDILVSASYYAWGVQKFLDVPGFMEYLLDRSTAKDKEAKVLKYNLISSIVAQSEVGNIVPPEILKQLRFYVNQGAFYVEATARVALDEQ
jgi:26S proteasome non-ATPase regulatory subunit 5